MRCFLVLCVYKLCYIGLTWASSWLIPFYSESMHFGVKSWPMEGVPNWQSRFTTYDVGHYLYLAVHGYKKDDPSCAYYSLYPGLIYCGHLLVGSPFWAAFLIVQLRSLLGIWLVCLALSEIYGGKESNRCVIMWLASPGALFLNVLYSEAVFIGLLGGVYFLAARWRWGAAAALSFFLPFGQAGGVVYDFAADGVCVSDARVSMTVFAFCRRPALRYIWEFFGFFLLLLPAIFRRGSFEFAWVIALGIIPAITNLFLSYTRFVTMAIPVFVVLARELENSEIRYWLTVAAFGVFQLILLFRHINFYWAG